MACFGHYLIHFLVVIILWTNIVSATDRDTNFHGQHGEHRRRSSSRRRSYSSREAHHEDSSRKDMTYKHHARTSNEMASSHHTNFVHNKYKHPHGHDLNSETVDHHKSRDKHYSQQRELKSTSNHFSSTHHGSASHRDLIPLLTSLENTLLASLENTRRFRKVLGKSRLVPPPSSDHTFISKQASKKPSSGNKSDDPRKGLPSDTNTSTKNTKTIVTKRGLPGIPGDIEWMGFYGALLAVPTMLSVLGIVTNYNVQKSYYNSQINAQYYKQTREMLRAHTAKLIQEQEAKFANAGQTWPGMIYGADGEVNKGVSLPSYAGRLVGSPPKASGGQGGQGEAGKGNARAAAVGAGDGGGSAAKGDTANGGVAQVGGQGETTGSGGMSSGGQDESVDSGGIRGGNAGSGESNAVLGGGVDVGLSEGSPASGSESAVDAGSGTGASGGRGAGESYGLTSGAGTGTGQV
ncbi:uncharacterized protein MEPE_01902 [Melanopsichium pennsylvanicum]|uniref:Uncharacterized protein n=2 Tax=Melanopsichium pennsylvanicum TaxID=63383 RepID=A0AAJ4XJQ2_9BASI|nr:uncharacterized protein MEPE_01902 [Melanopsichium pennsylvanicum]